MNETYHQHRQILIEYLLMKALQEDWHGVSDAANDLRELDAQQRGIEMTAKTEGKQRPARGYTMADGMGETEAFRKRTTKRRAVNRLAKQSRKRNR